MYSSAIGSFNGHLSESDGAVVNIAKSQGMAMGKWDTARRVLDIPYSDEIKILGFRMSPITKRSGDATWTRLEDSVRVKARQA
jgi:hypothetical protein